MDAKLVCQTVGVALKSISNNLPNQVGIIDFDKLRFGKGLGNFLQL
jgi:hypothetical protein